MNKYNVIFSGGGVGSTFALINFLKKTLPKISRSRSRRKKFCIAVIDKKISNFPGGVAYGKLPSQMGFFNNPCRLAPKHFTKWLIKKQSREKLIEYLSKQKWIFYKEWLEQNKNFYLRAKALSDIDEMYCPRVFFDFYLEEKFSLVFKLLKKHNKKNKTKISINFLQGELLKFNKIKKFYSARMYDYDYSEYRKLLKLKRLENNLYNCHFTQLTKYNINFRDNGADRISFSNPINIKGKSLLCENLFLALGLTAPKVIVDKEVMKDHYYLHDFYESGATSKLMNLIKQKAKRQNNKVTLHFLGSKSGFLEPLPEFKYFLNQNKIKLNIISSSLRGYTLNSAIFSKNKKKYKKKYFTIRKINQIKTPQKLLDFLKKEFENAFSQGYIKYDSWTQILKEGLITRILKKFSKEDRDLYYTVYLEKIRSMTRFTYPGTINAKRFLVKKNLIKMYKGKVFEVKKNSHKFIVKVRKSNSRVKTVYSDILVCVLGPQKMPDLIQSSSLFNSLVEEGALFSNTGLYVDKYFQIKNLKNVFLPGLHAIGYNPLRKTIIEAITNNSSKASNKLSQNQDP